MTGNHQVQPHLGALWTLLQGMRIEGPGAARRFEEALAAEKNWSLDFAERVTREYRRFLYLAALSAGEITPSRAVDAAWHLHLTYSRHYWDELCGRILGRPLHHNPSTGAAADEERFARQYEDTLALYRRTFGETPPREIWPSLATVPDEEEEPEAPDPAMRNITLASICIPILLVLGAVSFGGGGAFLGGAAGMALLSAVILHPQPPAGSPAKRKEGAGSGCGSSGCGGGSGGHGDGGGSCGGGGCGGGCGG
jgi:hypothetical protein